jgi:hypothetical protein
MPTIGRRVISARNQHSIVVSHFDSPLILSLSKDERLAQDRLSNHERSGGSFFDKLRTSGVQKRGAHETSHD